MHPGRELNPVARDLDELLPAVNHVEEKQRHRFLPGTCLSLSHTHYITCPYPADVAADCFIISSVVGRESTARPAVPTDNPRIGFDMRRDFY